MSPPNNDLKSSGRDSDPEKAASTDVAYPSVLSTYPALKSLFASLYSAANQRYNLGQQKLERISRLFDKAESDLVRL